VSENNAFCIIVNDNPLVEEDKDKLASLIQANRIRDRAESRSKGSRDILGAYLPLAQAARARACTHSHDPSPS